MVFQLKKINYVSLIEIKNMKAILKLWIFENHKFDVSSKKRSCIKGTH